MGERQTESGEEEKVKQERRSVKVGMKSSSGEEKKKRKRGRVGKCQTTSVKEGEEEIAVDVYGRKLSKQHL